ncbi:MAG: single-stranded DNA-binding protein [Tenericutes bacterium]|nr:single-stranded DNA-binding protein [Mycoplasmatota bacterium]
MLNQIVLVGRLVRNPEVYTTETGKKVTTITLAIPRSFKNINGEYETDFIDCILWENIAVSTSEYCSKGNIIGVKGRVQSRVIEREDKTKKYLVEVVAEKVTFLSTSKKDMDSNEEEAEK